MKKLIPISSGNIKRLTIETDNDGFSLWIKEPKGSCHWLVDGSTVLTDGVINLGHCKGIHKHIAVYNKTTKEIEIVEDPDFKK